MRRIDSGELIIVGRRALECGSDVDDEPEVGFFVPDARPHLTLHASPAAVLTCWLAGGREAKRGSLVEVELWAGGVGQQLSPHLDFNRPIDATVALRRVVSNGDSGQSFGRHKGQTVPKNKPAAAATSTLSAETNASKLGGVKMSMLPRDEVKHKWRPLPATC